MPSDFENQYARALWFLLGLYIAVAFGPWLGLCVIALIIHSAGGTWSNWYHWVGGGWAGLVLGVPLLSWGWRRLTRR